jgi:surface protein
MKNLKAIVSGILIFSITGFVSAQTPITDENFHDAIEECLSTNPIDGLCYSCQYGAMPDWDVSAVTDMSYAFYLKYEFNGDISNWDVGNVTNMSYMFRSTSFNQNIGSWDVSDVTNMTHMFCSANNFNQDIGSWDVSKVTDMQWMFQGAYYFNQDIGTWDVGNVTNMTDMFSWAVHFNQDIGSWDVSNVTNMCYVFFEAISFNHDIGPWDVSKVTHMTQMFHGASTFNQDIGSWDVSNVLYMDGLFDGAINFNQDISGWCVEQIPTEPSYFSFNCPLLAEYHPHWGEPCDPIGINIDFKENDILIFPNPALNIITIKFPGNQNTNSLLIKIYDVTGILILKQSEDSGKGHFNLDVSTINSGLYFIHIHSNTDILAIDKIVVK